MIYELCQEAVKAMKNRDPDFVVRGYRSWISDCLETEETLIKKQARPLYLNILQNLYDYMHRKNKGVRAELARRTESELALIAH